MKYVRLLAHLALYVPAIVFAIAATILACLLGCGCKNTKVTDPVVAVDSSYVWGGLREPVKSERRVLPCAAPEPHASPSRFHAP